MWLELLGLLLLSSVKFTVSAIVLAFRYSFPISFLTLVLGGILGIYFFWYFWGIILDWWKRSFPNTKKRTSSIKKKRRILNIKNRYGYWGLIILTPILLSIPIGVFLAKRYFSSRKYVIVSLIISIMVWATLLLSLAPIFHWEA